MRKEYKNYNEKYLDIKKKARKANELFKKYDERLHIFFEIMKARGEKYEDDLLQM